MDFLRLGKFSKKLMEYKLSNQKRIIKKEVDGLRVLRVICQRPYFTGSGINLINLTRRSQEKGIDQFVIYGLPTGEDLPFRDILEPKRTLPVTFLNEMNDTTPEIPFPVAGMSDQMPYKSTKFSEFDEFMLEAYLSAFAYKINLAVDKFKPNIIHSHHLWLVSALCRVLHPQIPMVATCHNTALRQLSLASQLKDFILNPIKDINVIAVQNEDQKNRVISLYDLESRESKFFNTGQAINTNIFYPSDSKIDIEEENEISIIYVGKLSNAKGVPQLITAFKEILLETDYNCHLNIVGSGDGIEKDNIINMTINNKDRIHLLGQLNQEDLSDYFRKSDLFILPSFYEGLPKVLFESLACGCRAIITDLPGIQKTMIDCCGETENVQYIPLPRMETIDKPMKDELPNFINSLKKYMKLQLSFIANRAITDNYSEKVRNAFGWKGLFETYLRIYNSLIPKK